MSFYGGASGSGIGRLIRNTSEEPPMWKAEAFLRQFTRQFMVSTANDDQIDLGGPAIRDVEGARESAASSPFTPHPVESGSPRDRTQITRPRA